MIVVAFALDRKADAAVRTPSMTEEEFELFYRKHSRGLWGYIAKVSGDATLADDLLQRTFFQFLGARHDTTDEARLRGYLYRIASNLIVDHWRERKRERDKSADMGDQTVKPVDPTVRWDLGRAFDELNPNERAMLWLAHVEGADHREIAAALGLRPGSIKVLLHRARRKLAGILESRGFKRGGSR